MRKQLMYTLIGFMVLIGGTALAVDDYALAYKKITELVTATGVPASGDFMIRYDASTGGPVKIDATDLSDVIGVGSTATELDENYFTVPMADFAAADTVYLASPVTGTLTKVYSVIWAQILNGAPALTVAVNSVNVTPATFGVASGDAAGTVDSLTVTGGGAVTAGQTISVATDGAGDSPVDGLIVFVVDL